MDTNIDEIAPQIYRFSTFSSQAGIVFNQFLIDADEPLLFHTGQRMLFPQLYEALGTIMDPKRLRWITFGHYEADESGAMNDWLRVAPDAVIAHGTIGVRTSIADQADRAPRALTDGDLFDLGNKRVRYLATPHVPHGWDAGLIFEETTGTLFTSDLFTRLGDDGAFTEADIVGPALVAEDRGHATALTPATAPTIRRLAELPIERLALMHAPTFLGDGSLALLNLADVYAARLNDMPAFQ
jgi:flavorubredoxin